MVFLCFSHHGLRFSVLPLSLVRSKKTLHHPWIATPPGPSPRRIPPTPATSTSKLRQPHTPPPVRHLRPTLIPPETPILLLSLTGLCVLWVCYRFCGFSVPMNTKSDSDALSEDESRSLFEKGPPLKDRDLISEKLDKFIDQNSQRPTRVVCVTSGGTTVPLEQRCVRFIDNFSSGQRGASSTEYFVKAGYAVIFLYRRGSLQPYSRCLPQDSFLDCFEVADSSQVRACHPHATVINKAVRDYHQAVEQGLLLKLPFTTVFEYSQILQMVALSMRRLGSNGMFYLAAAVSDFYVPWESMAEHKIQSRAGPLDMRLIEVPKMLGMVRKEWDPLAFCISFKLETDSEILLNKASMALKKYQVNAVVANLLATYKQEVIVVTENNKTTVRKQGENEDLEEQLIGLLVERHSDFLKQAEKPTDGTL